MWEDYLHVPYDWGIDIVDPFNDADFDDFYDNE